MMSLRTVANGIVGLGCGLAIAACGGTTGPGGPAVSLAANIVDPQSVNAVSDFNSCSGHAFPDTNSRNSAKNYFWPNSTNFSTNGVLPEFAVCSGTAGQNSDDTAANEQDRGRTLHLFCEKSSTSVRYFHLMFDASTIGQHFQAGDLIGYASMVGTGQSPSNTWQNSSNFDVAVIPNGDDATTQNYFAALDAATFSAWAGRGLTSVSQTVNPGNPVCSNFLSAPGSPDIFVFTPVR
jgi:hypothetical protein